MLAAILDPFDRACQFAGSEGDQEILGIEFAAYAEAAADIDLDQVDVILAKACLLYTSPSPRDS